MRESHFPWLWAAYKRGVFGNDFPQDLNSAGFTALLAGELEGLIRAGGDAYVLMAPTKRGVIPVGVALVVKGAVKSGHNQGEPFAYWFPEASPRNRLECTLKGLIDLKKDLVVRIHAPRPVWRFLDHLCKYGVIRRVGTVRGWYLDGDAGEWQGVR